MRFFSHCARLGLFRPCRGTVEDFLHDFQHVIADVTLVTGSKGVFDVEVDGELLFFKKATGRHAQPGGCLKLSAAHAGVAVYER